MPYLLLIVEPVGQRRERGLEEGKAAYAQMQQFAQQLQAHGVLQGVNSLASTEDSVRLQMRDGRQTLIDGPFAETKEMVGGYFLLDVATRDEALRWAAACPAAQWATIEVREVGPCYE